MRRESDFVQDRLIPFLVGLGITVGFSIACALVYGVSWAFIAAGGISSAAYDSPFGAAFGMWISAPLWLLILAANIGFWLLSTWLLGKWAQEKYRNYRQMQAEKLARGSAHEREAWFAEKQAAEQKAREAEWEKEWSAMRAGRNAASGAQSDGSGAQRDDSARAEGQEEKQRAQEAEWEQEWNLMKKQENGNSSSAKPEKSNSAEEQQGQDSKKETQ